MVVVVVFVVGKAIVAAAVVVVDKRFNAWISVSTLLAASMFEALLPGCSVIAQVKR